MSWRTTPVWNRKWFSCLLFEKSRWFKLSVRIWCEEPHLLGQSHSIEKNPKVSAKTVVVPFPGAQNKPPGQNYFVPDTKGQNSFVPGTTFLFPGQELWILLGWSETKNEWLLTLHRAFLFSSCSQQRRCSCRPAVINCRCLLRSFCHHRSKCRWQRWCRQQSERAVAAGGVGRLWGRVRTTQWPPVIGLAGVGVVHHQRPLWEDDVIERRD